MSSGARRNGPGASHVLVAGAGGLGCPAAWGLVEGGVGRVTVVDPDVVEESNLPRQVLFGEKDVGEPKAPVLARALAGRGPDVVGERARLDDRTAGRLLDGVDVVVDATDGALAKDWIHREAVRRRIALVHAAALGSEGRLLEVSPGGRPCLACLFGRLERETGSCADLGVWSGTVGAVGFLAAEAAIRRIEAPDAPSPGYAVLDVGTGRTFLAGAKADPDCPVCGPAASRSPEPYRAGAEGAPCAAPSEASSLLDLSGEECPMNLLRARRHVESVPEGTLVEIRLDREGAESVPAGLAAAGHRVVVAERTERGARLEVRSARRARSLRDERWLRRFARMIVLPEVGEAGQERIASSRVVLAGSGPARDAAAAYLGAAGLAALDVREAPRLEASGEGARVGEGDVLALVPAAFAPRAPRPLAIGALVADALLRRLVQRPVGTLP